MNQNTFQHNIGQMLLDHIVKSTPAHMVGGVINNVKNAVGYSGTLPKQISSILQMNPQQAQGYRNTVDQTVPKIPVNPKLAGGIVPGVINAMPNAVASAAKLPAARNPWQAAGDVANIAGGAIQGAGLLHAGVGAVNQLSQNPNWLTNQRGGYDPAAYNTSVDSMTSRPIRGGSLPVGGLDKATAQYPKGFNTGAMQVATQSPDLTLYEQAINQGDKMALNALRMLHPGDARFAVHMGIPGLH